MRKVLAVVLFAWFAAFAGQAAFPTAHHLLPPGTGQTDPSPIPFGDDNGGSH
jgi:hypothetical protein